jgi:hypothetical protein
VPAVAVVVVKVVKVVPEAREAVPHMQYIFIIMALTEIS